LYFEILDEIQHIEVIAKGRGIKDLRKLNELYGRAQWRKLKGIANVRLANGAIRRAELHWYEAHGKGRKKMKIKYFLD